MVRIASLCQADLYIGRNPINAFLLSYRLFITPTELLNKLAARYSAKDVRDTDDFSVVQLRVLAFMKVREAVPKIWSTFDLLLAVNLCCTFASCIGRLFFCDTRNTSRICGSFLLYPRYASESSEGFDAALIISELGMGGAFSDGL